MVIILFAQLQTNFLRKVKFYMYSIISVEQKSLRYHLL